MTTPSRKPTLSICALAGADHWHIEGFIKDLIGFADEIVFVVSPACPEMTLGPIKRHMAEGKIPIKLFTYYEEKDGPHMHYGKARNLSLENATMDYIILLDLDERFSTEFKENIRDFLNKEKPPVAKIVRVDDLVTHLVEHIDRIIKNDKTIWYGTTPESHVHEYPIHSFTSPVFPEPVWHSQRENHWLHRPQRIFHTIGLEIHRTPKTKSFFGHVLRGLWSFQFKFKKVYFQQHVDKDGKVGLKYAFMRALQAFAIQLFVGLKPTEGYKYWEDPAYEERLKKARLDVISHKN